MEEIESQLGMQNRFEDEVFASDKERALKVERRPSEI